MVEVTTRLNTWSLASGVRDWTDKSEAGGAAGLPGVSDTSGSIAQPWHRSSGMVPLIRQSPVPVVSGR